MFEPPAPGSHHGLLRVACTDPAVGVALKSETQTMILTDPGRASERRQPLWPPIEYRLTITRAGKVIHTEPVRMKSGEERLLSIPQLVEPHQTTELKPKAGPFPSDVVRMEIAPDRSAVAAGRFAGPIIVFDAATGKERFTLARPQTHCTAFGFTHDGQRLAYLTPADGPDHVLRVVDAADGRPVGTDLKPQAGRTFSNSHALVYSADGNRLAVSSAHNFDADQRIKSRVNRWELPPDAGPRELDPLQWQDGTIETLRFTPSGSEVLAAAGAHPWIAWAWDTGLPQPRNETEVDFTYDRVAVGGPTEAVAGWGQLTKRPVVMFSQRHADRSVFMAGVNLGSLRFSSLAVSANGKFAAAGVQGAAADRWEEQAAVRVWDTGTRMPRALLLGHTDWPLDLAFDRTGTGLVTAGKDGTVRHWRLP
jgi:WD40 repeat protein